MTTGKIVEPKETFVSRLWGGKDAMVLLSKDLLLYDGW
jgi:hypothetical protein